MKWAATLAALCLVVVVAAWFARPEQCLTFQGRELCGDEATAYCEATAWGRALLSRSESPERRRQAAEGDRICAPFMD